VTIVDAILLGVVEGLTELLPVSSTGHLILLGHLLGHEGEAAKSIDVVIQLGAVVAVAVFFRQRIGETVGGVLRREANSLRLLAALTAAFIPTAIVGLLLHELVKAHLFGATPVAAALIVGGIVMIGVEAVRHKRAIVGKDGLEHVTVTKGLIIGCCQCLALWPGTSRSMTTIVGGQLCGLSTKTSAEFSFLLALPTLGAATVYDFAKNHRIVLAHPGGATTLALGMVVSFFVTWLVVALFLRYVSRTGLAPFGIYRIALGIIVLSAMGSPG
jgi:undecaprenyl-diphosphatase